MFTGIITDVGEIVEAHDRSTGRLFRVKTRYQPETIDLGASIACHGVCLTVVAFSEPHDNQKWFEVEAWSEALAITNAANWEVGTKINNERAMKVGDEYGGHVVSGHVDGVVEVISIEAEGEASRVTFSMPPEFAKYIAPKGSVTLNGTSLTINGVGEDNFDVLLIRHTQEEGVTTWGSVQVGDKINIEVDQMARYVARYVDRLRALGEL